MNAKRISLLAMLITIAVVGRIIFTFIPNVQPMTTIIIIASFLVSPMEAIVIAVLSTILSNLYLGMGPWAIWQVLIWAMIGLISGLLGRVHTKIPLPILVMYAGFCGLFYGFIMSIAMSFIMEMDFWVYYLAGLPFDMSHAIGNMVFFAILYPVLFRLFKRKKVGLDRWM
ncbi:ECF transporter S component [Caldibacillus thermolactis]|jgi:energy-coupling factor transport system substrate-specific component|uniref:ECF transporter S component n=1 Tax=Pallidibacillus thermolactis TaxID=251051 RepID=A0ABT2WGJ9_9BACI|nr:ECF transporter S component [Pallidibacillus thermolactis]MCU9594813.1 ECF transporter S component [Pallidibacillus thermolactis]MCU9602265.1 ECF transporter S component [Pallidibacillus thermolactis subsp. kokeshiiformis]MED1673468.1 ECF transporter S component [Pallidibacillus thermolactis subsp. kokeshiiformis]